MELSVSVLCIEKGRKKRKEKREKNNKKIRDVARTRQANGSGKKRWVVLVSGLSLLLAQDQQGKRALLLRGHGSIHKEWITHG